MVTEGDLQRYRQIRNRYKGSIIIHPIMTGGIVPDEVQGKLFEEGWTRSGYTICWNCIEGRSSLIAKPPVRNFLNIVAEFFEELIEPVRDFIICEDTASQHPS